MKILIVSSFLPYPLFSGGHVRLYNLIKELSKNHEIILICEKRQQQTQDDIKEVERICKKVIVINRKKQWSFDNLLRSVSSKNSFLTTGHRLAQMQIKIKEVLEKEKFDLIHVETFYVMQNLPDVSIPVVLAEHNIEYQVYKRYADKVSSVFRPFLYIDIDKIKKEEKFFWKRADRLIAVSKDDQAVMKNDGLDPIIVANGVDIEKFSFKKEIHSYAKASAGKGKILFIGDFKWIQNRDAAKFIIREVWPMIKSKAESQKLKVDLKLWIVGRKIPNSIKNLANDPDIIFDEKNSNKLTQELFKEASILLAPIRVGGGTSYKILESMSCGTPVVTTKMSAEAIGAVDGEEILIGETAEVLAEKTLYVLKDRKLYEKISKNARLLIEKNYTWEKIAKDLENAYRSVI